VRCSRYEVIGAATETPEVPGLFVAKVQTIEDVGLDPSDLHSAHAIAERQTCVAYRDALTATTSQSLLVIATLLLPRPLCIVSCE
jgi:hypothetical protein